MVWRVPTQAGEAPRAGASPQTATGAGPVTVSPTRVLVVYQYATAAAAADSLLVAAQAKASHLRCSSCVEQ